MTTQQNQFDVTKDKKYLNNAAMVAGFLGPLGLAISAELAVAAMLENGKQDTWDVDPRQEAKGGHKYFGHKKWHGGCTSSDTYYAGTQEPISIECIIGKCYDKTDAGKGQEVNPCPDSILYPKKCQDGSGAPMYCAFDAQSPNDMKYPKQCFDPNSGRNWYCEGDIMDPNDPDVQAYMTALSKVAGQMDMLFRKKGKAMVALNETYRLNKMTHDNYMVNVNTINSLYDQVSARVTNNNALGNTDVATTDAVKTWNDLEYKVALQRITDIYNYEMSHKTPDIMKNDPYNNDDPKILASISDMSTSAISNGSIEDGTDANANATWVRITQSFGGGTPTPESIPYLPMPTNTKTVTFGNAPADPKLNRVLDIEAYERAHLDPNDSYAGNGDVLSNVAKIVRIDIANGETQSVDVIWIRVASATGFGYPPDLSKIPSTGGTSPLTNTGNGGGKTNTPKAVYDSNGNLLTSTGVNKNSPASRDAVDALYSKDYQALKEYYNIGVMDYPSFENRLNKLIKIHQLAYANIVKGYLPYGAYLNAKQYVLNYNSKGGKRFVIFPPLTADQKYKADLAAWQALHPGQSGNNNATPLTPDQQYQKDMVQYNNDLATWQALHPGQSGTPSGGTNNATTLTPEQQYQQEMVQYNNDVAAWQALHPGQSL